jgi:xylulokinase
MLPYFAGERTPILDPRARGTITGLTLRHTRGHLYRAALEGIACGIRHNLDALPQAYPIRAVCVGGGTRESLWPQIVSDVTGMAQTIPQETVGASYGDALLAALGTGLAAHGTSWAIPAQTIEPNPDVRELYDALYTRYRALYPATRDLQHALADLQGSA